MLKVEICLVDNFTTTSKLSRVQNVNLIFFIKIKLSGDNITKVPPKVHFFKKKNSHSVDRIRYNEIFITCHQKQHLLLQ